MAIKEPMGGPDTSVPAREHGEGHFPLDKVTFGVAAGLAVAFLLWGTVDSTGMTETTGKVLGELTSLFGWLFILVSATFLLFSAYLAVTPCSSFLLLELMGLYCGSSLSKLESLLLLSYPLLGSVVGGLEPADGRRRGRSWKCQASVGSSTLTPFIF